MAGIIYQIIISFMGRQRGIVHLSGQFDDTQMSIDGKKGIAKLSVPVSKDRIMKDEAYEMLRKNMAEFKGASIASDILTQCFGGNGLSFGDRYMRSRMITQMRSIVTKGPGLHGERMFEVTPNLADFKHFELNLKDGFRYRFRAKYTVTPNVDRNSVTLDVPPFLTKGLIRKESYMKHFRLTLAIGVLTDLVFVGGKDVYESTHPDLAGEYDVQYSNIMECNGTPNLGFQIVATLPGSPILPADACLVVTVGIEFFKMVNNVPSVFAACNAMMVHGAY
jgi:hypothetical protein